MEKVGKFLKNTTIFLGAILFVICTIAYIQSPGAAKVYTVQTVEQYKQIAHEKQNQVNDELMFSRMRVCDDLIKKSASHPSTVSISSWGSEYNYDGNNWSMTRVFTAKNSFGLELKNEATCGYNGKTAIFKIQEVS
jgi:hypothetical protein